MDDDNRYSHEGRSRMYKSNGRDQNELRRKRRDDEVQIRKNRREERFDRNRRITVKRPLSDEQTSLMMKAAIEGLQSLQSEKVQESVAEILEHVEEKSWSTQVLAKAEMLNKLADTYCNRPVSKEIRELISRIFVRTAGLEHSESQSTDIACIESIVANLSSFDSDEDVLCDTLQSLSVFVIRSITYRNLALDSAIVPELLNLCGKNLSVHMNRSLMWMVSLFCEKVNQYSPDVEEIAPLLDIVAFGIQSADTMIQTDATSACVSLADWPPIHEHMRASQLTSMLVANLRNENGNARPGVKWGISSIIQSTSYFTDEMINAGLLEVLKGFVNVSFMSQEVCFIISNICAEGEHTIDRLISSGVLREVSRVMEAAEYRARKEAAFVVCHCCASSNRDHLGYVLEMGMLNAFTDLLTCMDASLVAFILDAIQSLLQYGESNLAEDYTNPVAVKLEQIGCREKLEFLCESQCVDIHAKAYTILDRYFDEDEVPPDFTADTLLRNNIDDTIDLLLMRTSAQSS